MPADGHAELHNATVCMHWSASSCMSFCAFQHHTTATHQAERENVGQLSVSSGRPDVWVVGEGIFKKCLYCPYTAFNIPPIWHSSSSAQPMLRGKVELIFCQFSSLIQRTTSSDKCQSLFKIKKRAVRGRFPSL